MEGRLRGATPTSGLASLRSPFLLSRKRPVTATVSEVGDMLGQHLAKALRRPWC